MRTRPARRGLVRDGVVCEAVTGLHFARRRLNPFPPIVLVRDFLDGDFSVRTERGPRVLGAFVLGFRGSDKPLSLSLSVSTIRAEQRFEYHINYL